jgi:isoleucyl-tRNA synthetase
MKSVFVIVLAVLLTACGSRQIKPSEIEVNTPHQNLEEIEFVVLLASSNHDPKKFKEFAHEVVKSQGFSNVLNHTEYARLIIEKGLEDKIEAKYDLISLHKAYKELGEFLVIQLSSNYLGGSWHNIYLKVTDAKSSETLLNAGKEGQAWSSKKAEFVDPMVTLFKEWKNSSVESQP